MLSYGASELTTGSSSVVFLSKPRQAQRIFSKLYIVSRSYKHMVLAANQPRDTLPKVFNIEKTFQLFLSCTGQDSAMTTLLSNSVYSNIFFLNSKATN